MSPTLFVTLPLARDENVIVSDQLFEFRAISLSFLCPVVALGSAGEWGVGEVVVMALGIGVVGLCVGDD